MTAIQKKIVDLIVIGAGSGGLEAAWNVATELKKTVAVIDAQKEHGPPFYAALGGTCVNVGCVPKKLMAIGAGYREVFRDAKGFGYDMKNPFDVKHSWAALIDAKNRTVSDINKSYQGMFDDTPGLSLHLGWGRFVDNKTVEVVDSTDGTTVKEILQAEHILVATGGWPAYPDTKHLAENSITSNEIFYLKEVPKRVLIIGGGYIAVEFASILRSFAAEDATITLAYRGDLFLRGFDTDVRECLAEQMRARGIDVRFNCNITEVDPASTGSPVKKVAFCAGKEGFEEFDLIICATGRNPNTHRLQLDKAGLKTERDGSIGVDKFSRTSVANIFAIGDVTNRVQLTPVAIHEAQCFTDTLAGSPRSPDHENVPCAVFAIPQIGTVGLTEEQAKAKFATVAVYVTKTTPLMHQLTGNAFKKCVLKLVADHSTGKVVGIHICAPEAGEMIQGFAVAVKAGATMRDFTSTIGVHPTLAEDLCSMRTPSYFYVNGERQEKLNASL